MNEDDKILVAVELKWKRVHAAYALGQAARQQGKGRVCDLVGDEYYYENRLLDWYSKAWEDGYDGVPLSGRN